MKSINYRKNGISFQGMGNRAAVLAKAKGFVVHTLKTGGDASKLIKLFGHPEREDSQGYYHWHIPHHRIFDLMKAYQ